MTDTDIIKALECCIKEQCEKCCNLGRWHEQWNCMRDIMEKSLDLINRQKAEIDQFADIGKMYSEIKSEAIREFAERLKASFGYGWLVCSGVRIHIDNLVKEMTEGEK